MKHLARIQIEFLREAKEEWWAKPENQKIVCFKNGRPQLKNKKGEIVDYTDIGPEDK
jgi:hypothetical protein